MNKSIGKVNWVEILIFFLIAIFVSLPFRLGLLSMEKLLPLPNGLNIFYRILRGVGPLIGYLVVFFIFKSKVTRENTFFGKNGVISFISILPILVGLSITGVFNQEQIPIHFYGFLSSIMLVLYALAEEYGWRGYLQLALKPLPLLLRIIVIGTLWYIWHLNFLNPSISLKMHLIHLISLYLGAWGLLKISEATSSLLFVSSVHLIFNILFDVNCAMFSKLIIVSVAILVWVILLVYLARANKSE